MRLIGFLAFLAIVVLVVGYFLGWFQLSRASSAAGGSTEWTLRVDEEEVKEDTRALREKLSELGSDKHDAPAGQTQAAGRLTLKGTLLALDEAAGTLAIEVAGKGRRELRFDDELEVEIDGAAGSAVSLAAGDSVSVQFVRADDGVDRAVLVRR